ncbi:MAG TPA: AraC family transcriptional regulator [Planctomycetota bacterium]|nr:AraC family transcriptional regulator [Planctomycetota bacterium]
MRQRRSASVADQPWPQQIVDYRGARLRAQDYFQRPDIGIQVYRLREMPAVLAHAHEFQEIVYIVRGSAEHEVTGPDGAIERYPLLPGDCFVIGRDERHAVLRPRRIELCNVLFTPEPLVGDASGIAAVPGVDALIGIDPDRPRGVKMHLTAGERESVMAGIEAMLDETERGAPGQAAAMRGLLIVLLVHLARAWTRTRGEELPSRPGRGRDALDQARAWIEEHYARPLTLADIAARAQLSPGHFSERFKQRFGIGPWEFLAELRIARARHLLRTTDATVTQIALAVGFSDSSYFARVFRDAVGATPRGFRARR